MSFTAAVDADKVEDAVTEENPNVMTATLRLLLGDQLNIQHSWFSKVDATATYVMMEVYDEASYVTHHIQKIAAFFLAMRAFRDELLRAGHRVIYLALDHPENRQSLDKNIENLLRTAPYTRFEFQTPDEYRVRKIISALSARLSVATHETSSEHFLADQDFFSSIFKGHKRYVMETFYRAVRRKHSILLDNGEPVGGAWNFDSENRSKLPAKLTPPAPIEFNHDASEIVKLLAAKGVQTIGQMGKGDTLTWPLTRTEALATLEYFCTHLLPSFGSYQDAMHTDYRFLFHSRLSCSMNMKLISPAEVINRAIQEWQSRPAEISIPQIEGFVRQIAGWREFIRGVYWAHMPGYKELNFLNARRALPHYFWDGETRMNCMQHAIEQSLEESYAHHIQRLMITGNFALIAGLDPEQVNAWYLGIYADAIEWVQLPNTHGMSQFADGGIVGTKPYCASANYIGKMSNYCNGCFYKAKERLGPNACPFNSLYWDFLIRNREKLERNPRIGMAYRSLANMRGEDIAKITAQAEFVLTNIESL
jgi:deoxyribodipyrimidine photolyase-related protein